MISVSPQESSQAFLRLPLGRHGASVVPVAARGLWDELTPPDSSAAHLRAYQRAVPSCLRVRAAEEPEDGALDAGALEALVDRCLRYAPPRLAVSFFVEARSPRSAAELLELAALLDGRGWPGFQLVQRWDSAGERGLFPIGTARGGHLAAAREEIWGWRCPLDDRRGAEDDAAFAAALDELGVRRLVVDSPDVLESVGAARSAPPAADASWLEQLAANRPSLEIWRVTDLLQAVYLDLLDTYPLA